MQTHLPQQYNTIYNYTNNTINIVNKEQNDKIITKHSTNKTIIPASNRPRLSRTQEKKANETQKPALTKKTKTQTRKDKSMKTPTTVFIEDDAMSVETP